MALRPAVAVARRARLRSVAARRADLQRGLPVVACRREPAATRARARDRSRRRLPRLARAGPTDPGGLMYALFYDYVENIVELRAPFREEHLALCRDWKPRLVMGGALGDPPHGALIVFDVSARRIEPWNVVV